MNRRPALRAANETVHPSIQRLPVAELNLHYFPSKQRRYAFAGPAPLILVYGIDQHGVFQKVDVPPYSGSRSRVWHRTREVSVPVKPAMDPCVADEARSHLKEGGNRAAATARKRPINEKVLRGVFRHVPLTALIFEMLPSLPISAAIASHLPKAGAQDFGRRYVFARSVAGTLKPNASTK
jgi:hypothetical protein